MAAAITHIILRFLSFIQEDVQGRFPKQKGDLFPQTEEKLAADRKSEIEILLTVGSLKGAACCNHQVNVSHFFDSESFALIYIANLLMMNSDLLQYFSRVNR
jgi:hypothetical protein